MMDRKLEQLAKCLILRLRKGALPNPGTSVFDALPADLAEESIDIEGTIIQRFGDGNEETVEAFGRQVSSGCRRWTGRSTSSAASGWSGRPSPEACS